MPDEAGNILSDGTNFGVYIGNGEVIFASKESGCVTKEKVADGAWNAWSSISGAAYNTAIKFDEFDESKKNNLGLVQWAIQAHENGWGYIYGTYGNVLTESLLQDRAAVFGSEVTDYMDFIRQNWLGKRTADCVGLIKGYGWYDSTSGEIRVGSNGMMDVGANAMFANATVKGTLDSVMVYPCQDCCELGKTVIENEMMPELEGCSDEILELLDRDKIGSIFQERDGGKFIDGCYCVTSGYEPPDINIEIGRPERCFFRLLVAPDSEKREQAHWVTLPFDEEKHLYLSEMKCLEFQSSLPGITKKSFNKVLEMRVLNQFSEKLSELPHNDFVKLKAVMEVEDIHDISHCIECAEHLDEYQFDQSVQDYNEFGIAYLSRTLPTNFDNSALENVDLYDFGMKILAQTGGEVTSYGAISGRGQELYSALTVQPEQQLDEDIVEDIKEDFEMEMGGMSL